MDLPFLFCFYYLTLPKFLNFVLYTRQSAAGFIRGWEVSRLCFCAQVAMSLLANHILDGFEVLGVVEGACI